MRPHHRDYIPNSVHVLSIEKNGVSETNKMKTSLTVKLTVIVVAAVLIAGFGTQAFMSQRIASAGVDHSVPNIPAVNSTQLVLSKSNVSSVVDQQICGVQLYGKGLYFGPGVPDANPLAGDPKVPSALSSSTGLGNADPNGQTLYHFVLLPAQSGQNLYGTVGSYVTIPNSTPFKSAIQTQVPSESLAYLQSGNQTYTLYVSFVQKIQSGVGTLAFVCGSDPSLVNSTVVQIDTALSAAS